MAGVKSEGVVHRLGPFGDEALAARERDRLALALGNDDLILTFHAGTGEEVHGARRRDLDELQVQSAPSDRRRRRFRHHR